VTPNVPWTAELEAHLRSGWLVQIATSNADPLLAAARRWALRHRVGITQEQLARRFRCSQPMISGLIRGTERSRRLEERFAALAGLPWPQLFTPSGAGLDTRPVERPVQTDAEAVCG